MKYTHQAKVEHHDGLPRAAAQIIEAHPQKRVFALHGAMGAGKTTLVKEICKHLGSADNAVSPTFSIVNEYNTASGETIYHFDFYRIKSIDEAYNIGYEEYFYSGSYCFVEWPGIIEPLLPPDCVHVEITDQNGVRFIRF